MQVAFHLGAHSTDEDRLVKTLLRNNDVLTAADIAVPSPMRYRMVLRDALVALKGHPADHATQETVLDAVTEQDNLRRIVFSHEFFLGIPQRVISEDGFYGHAAAKLQPLTNLFPEAETEFHMALVNPAVLIPALIGRIEGASAESVLSGHDPRALRWAPVVRAMVRAAAGRRFVIWCHEDTPLIWPEVLRNLAGLPADQLLAGDFTILAMIMSPEGLERLKTYLASHPPQSVARRRRIVTAFLDKFALPERLETEIALPGWTEALVDDITAAYDADVAEIAAMPGVAFITP